MTTRYVLTVNPSHQRQESCKSKAQLITLQSNGVALVEQACVDRVLATAWHGVAHVGLQASWPDLPSAACMQGFHDEEYKRRRTMIARAATQHTM